MKIKLEFVAVLLFCSAAWGQNGVPRFTAMNGLPTDNIRLTLHVQGKPVAARLLAIKYHRMGCEIYDFCQIGLNIPFRLETGADEANCSLWHKEVRALDKGKDPYTGPFAYLEMVFDSTFKQILTDEGLYLFPAGAVKCNGSLDWTGMAP